MEKRIDIRLAMWVGTVMLSMVLGQGMVRATDFVKAQEIQQRNQWSQKHLLDPKAKMPFSFLYDGQASEGLLTVWPKNTQSEKLDAARTQHTIIWNDAKTGLEVRCVVVEYSDYPALEWTVYFKNMVKDNTAILENIQGADFEFAPDMKGDPWLHYIDGDGMYTPHETALSADIKLNFMPSKGRPTDGCFPCYNLDWKGRGVILAVGWPGQWASSFLCDAQGSVRFRAGQELTHFRLYPGEEVRSPLVVLLFWEGGDWIRAQNLWRRWMRQHNMPKPGGKPVEPVRAGGGFMYEKLGWGADLLNEKDQKTLIDRYEEEKIKLNGWWIDILGAGTYSLYTDQYIQNSPYMVSWETDRTRFPNGLRAVSEYARAKGEKLLVWIEPEHVNANNVLFQHQDWLLSVPDDPNLKKQINQGAPLGERRVVNLGHPDAWKWTCDFFVKLIGEEGIAIYRQDFNIEPLLFWRYGDAPDRQGITENLYIQGYLRFWDVLLEHYPHLLIDSCSSGGRRNDLETLRRSVPLWRSDAWGPDVVLQNQTFGLALWIPFFGTGTNVTSTYQFRSSLGSSLFTSWDVRDRDLNYPLLRQLNTEFWQTAPFFVEDYYPLTVFNPASDVWMAWQFNRPEQGDGVVQAFRRNANQEDLQTFRLRGLDPMMEYEVTNFDVAGSTRVSGKDLMETGLIVPIANVPGAAVIMYHRIR